MPWFWVILLGVVIAGILFSRRSAAKSAAKDSKKSVVVTPVTGKTNKSADMGKNAKKSGKNPR
jgi:hypothetical protein